MIHQDTSEDLPKKSAGRAALSSVLEDMVGGGAASDANAAGGAVGIVLGLGVRGLVTGGTMDLGLIGVLEGSTEMLVGSLRGLSYNSTKGLRLGYRD